MIKRNFVFTVSLIAMFAVSSAWADAATGNAVGTAHTVYDNSGLNMAESGIAGVTYVNRMVNAAGNSAQKAEAHAASAGASALSAAADAKDAADAADAAAQAAQTANNTLANKQDKLVAGSNITIAADGKTISATDTKYSAGSNISLSGTTFNVPTANGTNLGVVKQGSNITIASDGTISATDMRYTLPTASSDTKGGVKIGSGVNVASDGTISVAAPGNATLTIQRNGTNVGTFTANASSAKTINITDSDTTYTAGSNVTISDENVISVDTTATPAANSTVPLTAGGAYTALGKKQDTIGDLATIRSGAAAGATALQKADITTGSANGTISVDGTNVSVKGLGSAAYANTTAFDAAGAASTAKSEAIADAASKYQVKALVTSQAEMNAAANKAAVYPSASLMESFVNDKTTGLVTGLGDVDNLETTAENVVGAINEVKDTADSALSKANAAVVANAAITAGTGSVITYDAKGLVTSGRALQASDIPTIGAAKVSGLASVATSGSYNDLSNKPAINNATLTIKNGATGSNLATFTANASSGATATIPAATAEVAGLARYGQIPSGGETSPTYATIWVE